MEIENNKYYSLWEIVENKIIPVTYLSLYKLVCSGQINATNFSTGKIRKRWKIKGEELIKFLEDRSK
jgi:hypothetical protein